MKNWVSLIKRALQASDIATSVATTLTQWAVAAGEAATGFGRWQRLGTVHLGERGQVALARIFGWASQPYSVRAEFPDRFLRTESRPLSATARLAEFQWRSL
ncbi:hypothetical protein OKW43_005750 [Paraburkholderia sp. WC7.3g]